MSDRIKTEKKINIKEVIKAYEESSSELSEGIYSFTVFLTDYYRRIRINYGLDFDSWMILMVVISHTVYELNKIQGTKNKNFDELYNLVGITLDDSFFSERKRKLGVTNIANILEMPDETARRKIDLLMKKDFLFKSKEDGVRLGEKFKEIHKKHGQKTLKSMGATIRAWQKSGLIQAALDHKF